MTAGLEDYREDNDADKEGNPLEDDSDDDQDDEELDVLQGVNTRREQSEEEEAEALALLLDEVKILTPTDIKIGHSAIVKVSCSCVHVCSINFNVRIIDHEGRASHLQQRSPSTRTCTFL